MSLILCFKFNRFCEGKLVHHCCCSFSLVRFIMQILSALILHSNLKLFINVERNFFLLPFASFARIFFIECSMLPRVDVKDAGTS